MTDEALVSKICDEDAFLNNQINNEATFSVRESWTGKMYTKTPRFKTV